MVAELEDAAASVVVEDRPVEDRLGIHGLVEDRSCMALVEVGQEGKHLQAGLQDQEEDHPHILAVGAVRNWVEVHRTRLVQDILHKRLVEELQTFQGVFVRPNEEEGDLQVV